MNANLVQHLMDSVGDAYEEEEVREALEETFSHVFGLSLEEASQVDNVLREYNEEARKLKSRFEERLAKTGLESTLISNGLSYMSPSQQRALLALNRRRRPNFIQETEESGS